MQVFGALVAVDAVFLVFQHQNLAAMRSRILFLLGRYVTMMLRHHHMYDLYDRQDVLDKVDREADAFEALGCAEIEERISRAEKWLSDEQTRLTQSLGSGNTQNLDRNAAISNLKDIKTYGPQFKFHVAHYRGLTIREQEKPSLLVRIMGVPSALVVFFALLLAPAGKLSEFWNLVLGVSAVIIAACGLIYLVITAKKIIKPLGPTRDEPRKELGLEIYSANNK